MVPDKGKHFLYLIEAETGINELCSVVELRIDGLAAYLIFKI